MVFGYKPYMPLPYLYSTCGDMASISIVGLSAAPDSNEAIKNQHAVTQRRHQL